MFEKYYKLKENGTTVRTEVIAGLTTFFTMAYILFVNPNIISEGAGINGENAEMIANGVFFATCIASFIGTILMALYAKIPFAQAPGMGLNAFFAYTVMVGYGYAYNQALGIVFISGLLFMLITLTGLRGTIVKSIPTNVKTAISAGIGLFLAFLGLQNAGLVVGNSATLVSLVDFTGIGAPETKGAVMSAILTVIGLIIIAALSTLKVRGAILIGIIATTIIGIPMGITTLPGNFQINFGQQFSDFTQVSLFSFAGGLRSIFADQNFIQSLFTLGAVVISFSMVDMFDTIGTLLGTAKQAGLMRKDGTMKHMNEALLCDAIATTTGAMLGTSTVTTYVESAAGIGEGGRTGLTSLVTALLFLAAIILAPFVGIIPSAATAPALIYVGCLMISAIKDLKWDDMSEAVPAFLTIAMMPLTYSIANGIAFGLISYVLIKLFSGRYKQIHPLCAVLAALFIARYFFMSM